MLVAVSDVKQYRYCPRIVFYRHVFPLCQPVTPKMRSGKAAHGRIEKLEKRRSLREFGFERAERRFRVRLESERVGLSGIVDLVLVTEDALYPVEVKETTGGLRLNHKYQLAAYALLLEEEFGQPAPAGFLLPAGSGPVERVELDEEAKVFVQRTIRQIRRMVDREEMPDPTPRRSRCRDCEYLRFCNDIDFDDVRPERSRASPPRP